MSNVWAKPGRPLTQREWQICQMAAQGKTAKQIAVELHIGYRTVEEHRLAAYGKYGVHSMLELMHKLNAQGMPCLCCGRAAE